MYNREEELAVIRSVLNGRQADYAILVSRYQQYVFSLALRYVDNRELAEELAQDVFIKAYTNLASFKGESKFSTWLYTIVHTTCLSHLRKTNNNPLLPGAEQIVSIADSGNQAKPILRLEENGRKETLNKAIKHLPDTDAEVLTLFYMADQSVEEISRITGVTAANVKVRLFRARQKLKEIIETHYKQELMN